MKHFLFISLLSTVYCTSIYGQQQITIDDIIAKIYEQNSIDIPDSYKLPWIEEINVRSETRDWKLDEQSYSVRLRPVSMGERRASSKLYNSWQQEIVNLKLDKIYDKIADLHEDYVDQDFLLRKMNLDKQIVALLLDIEKVTSKQSLIDTEKLPLLLSVRSRIAKLRNSIVLREKRRNEKIIAISQQVEGNHTLIVDSIDLQTYIQSAKEILLITDRPFISANDALELQTLKNEMELEKAEGNRVLDFLALQYRGPHDDAISERVSLGMSFNLPFFSGSQLSMAKLKVEQEREQYRIEISKEESLAEMKEIKESILSNLFEYDSYKRLYTQLEAENFQLISNIAKQSIINPIIKLNHQIQVLDNKLSLLGLQENIINKYLDYLKATDKYIMGVDSLSSMK